MLKRRGCAGAVSWSREKEPVEEKERQCIFCGKWQDMLGYICPACQDRIQQEVINRKREARGEKVTDKIKDDSEDNSSGKR
jgi:hypothetical protein